MAKLYSINNIHYWNASYYETYSVSSFNSEWPLYCFAAKCSEYYIENPSFEDVVGRIAYMDGTRDLVTQEAHTGIKSAKIIGTDANTGIYYILHNNFGAKTVD